MVLGMPFSGVERVCEQLRTDGEAVVMAPLVPIARCTEAGVGRALAVSLAALSADQDIVVVYRNPWDSTLASLGSAERRLVADPGVMRRAWLAYHREVLSILRTRKGGARLVSADALVGGPEGAAPTASRGFNDPIAELYGSVYPELVELLAQLNDIADVAMAQSGPSTPRIAGHLRPAGSLPAGEGVQVVLPCRDDGRYIVEAVASVARSFTSPVELTIVDDGSCDPETLRVMSHLADLGYQVIRTSGIGLSQARNVATRESVSAAVVPLDADNLLRPALAEGLAAISSGGADVVYGPVQYFGMKDHVFRPAQLSRTTVLPYNTVDACALVRRALLDDVGGWDPAVRLWEDWDFWMGALEKGARFQMIDDITFDYCVRPGSILRTSGVDRQARADAYRYIFDKHQAWLGEVMVDGFIALDEERVQALQELERARVESSLMRAQSSVRDHA